MSDTQNSSFLEQMPKAFDQRTRLVFETCSMAGSIVSLAIESVKKIALDAYSRDPIIEFTALERRMMFMYAWSIVDQIHTFGSLVHLSSDLIDLEVAELKPFLYSARKLRNAMDHAPQNLQKKGNIILSKAQTPSLFGALTFNKIGSDDYVNGMINHLNVVCVLAGSFLDAGKLNMQPAYEAFTSSPSVIPLDNFILHAYGSVLNLSKAAFAVTSIISGIDSAVKVQWETKIKPLVEKNEINASELSQPRPGNCTLHAVARFDPIPFDVQTVA